MTENLKEKLKIPYQEVIDTISREDSYPRIQTVLLRAKVNLEEVRIWETIMEELPELENFM